MMSSKKYAIDGSVSHTAYGESVGNEIKDALGFKNMTFRDMDILSMISTKSDLM